jgi:hypothetical protein
MGIVDGGRLGAAYSICFTWDGSRHGHFFPFSIGHGLALCIYA